MNNNVTTNSLIRNIIIALDFLMLWIVMLLYMKYGPQTVHLPFRFVVFGTVSLAFSEAMVLPVVHKHYLSVDMVMRRVISMLFTFAVTFFVLCSAHRWIQAEIISGKGVGMVSLCFSACLAIMRVLEFFIIRLGRSKGRNSRSLAFVGDIADIQHLLYEIDCNAVKGLRLRGYYSDKEDEKLSQRMPYKGNYELLKEHIAEGKRFADDLYCTLPSKDGDLISLIMGNCMEHVTRFYYLPPFIRIFGNVLQPQMIGSQVVFTSFSEPLTDPANRFVKRAFDIVLSGIATLLFLPFVPIIALIIKLQSPGPVLFKQTRTGMDGKDFNMYKFRSMHVNKDADRLQATKDDPRKFAFGNFMRKTNIDELPQVFNVLLGDMSIVGPRPHMLAHTEEYRNKIEEYMVRHYVRPGITGWAQVTGFRGETAELWQMEGRVKRDIWYIQNWTFWLDIRIILKTAWNMIHKEANAY